MSDELVGLLEGALVEQEIDALAGGHLAVFVLAGAAFGTASGFWGSSGSRFLSSASFWARSIRYDSVRQDYRRRGSGGELVRWITDQR